jgi:hypothetical protein
MRVVQIAIFAFIAPLTLAVAATPRVQRTVPCSESIDRTPFPFLGNRQPQQRYRLVLDAISVPPAYLRQVIATHEQPWRYWRKAGLVVRAGDQAVTITVPRRWRARVAITWGNAGHGAFHALRIAGCGGNTHTGNAYAGGFYLQARSACVPVTFRLGARSATVHFGIGRRCS